MSHLKFSGIRVTIVVKVDTFSQVWEECMTQVASLLGMQLNIVIMTWHPQHGQLKKSSSIQRNRNNWDLFYSYTIADKNEIMNSEWQIKGTHINNNNNKLLLLVIDLIRSSTTEEIMQQTQTRKYKACI